MGYKTVTVDVDVYVDDVIDLIPDQELIDELNSRGYTVTKDVEREVFEREDWKLLLEVIDTIPETVYTRRVREKLMEARFG